MRDKCRFNLRSSAAPAGGLELRHHRRRAPTKVDSSAPKSAWILIHDATTMRIPECSSVPRTPMNATITPKVTCKAIDQRRRFASIEGGGVGSETGVKAQRPLNRELGPRHTLRATPP